MFGAKKSFLEQELQDWHVDCWSWLIRWGGGADSLRKTRLILPTKEFFPPTDAKGHARAIHIFNAVKHLANMEEWPAKLVPQAELPRDVGPMMHVQHGRTAAGTFSHDGNAAQITYDPASLDQPVVLIATFAHELGHYLLAGFPVLLPPSDMEEPATDVASIFLGFGLFGASSAFNFQQFTNAQSQGWSTQRLGYLSEQEWAFGLAMFAALTSCGMEAMKTHLKPTLWSEVKQASRIIERDGLATRVLAQAMAGTRH